MGFETPTPIQEQAIPAILQGRDIIGSAQTGTGKTAAFLLPVIQNIIASREASKTRALVIVPTRELAQQIDQLRKKAQEILAETKRDQQLHRVRCGFKKRPGGIYYLYSRKDNSLLFSIISPDGLAIRPRIPAS